MFTFIHRCKSGACIVLKRRTQTRKRNDAKENYCLKSYGKIKTERQQNHAGKMLSRKIKRQNVRKKESTYTHTHSHSQLVAVHWVFYYYSLAFDSHSFSNKFTSISIFRSGFSEWMRWRCRWIKYQSNCFCVRVRLVFPFFSIYSTNQILSAVAFCSCQHHRHIYEHFIRWDRRHDNKQTLFYSYLVKIVCNIVALWYILFACNDLMHTLFLPQQCTHSIKHQAPNTHFIR